jgi:predicted MFS family arabinose efflux permease
MPQGRWNDKAFRDLALFFAAIASAGLGAALIDSVFNNFIRESFNADGFSRSALEFPREIPGFLNAFAVAALAFLPRRRIASLSFFVQAAGVAFLGLFSTGWNLMTAWLFIYSLGQHIFLPLQSSIGMEIASEGREGSRLGQVNAAGNMARLVGGLAALLGIRLLRLDYRTLFLGSAACFALGGVALAGLSVPPPGAKRPGLFLRKEYSLFYFLSVLYGTRKQLFITFGPWVIVETFGKRADLMALLYFLAGGAGVLLQPFIGRLIDRIGERAALSLEAVLLVPVCLCYGFSKFILPESAALAVVCACYVIDSILMSFSMARFTYLKRTCSDPRDVAPTLAMGVSIDHVFSISIALISGVVWKVLGFQWVFAIGAAISLVNLYAARFVRTPVGRLSAGG